MTTDISAMSRRHTMAPTPSISQHDEEVLSAAAPPPAAIERRLEMRAAVACDLWMIDHHGSTVMRCHCVDSSNGGMRLRVPLGYGVAEGQRYELRSHLPGARNETGFGLIGSRWATVVRTRMCLQDNEDHLEIGVLLDQSDAPLHLPS
jgi:hypothetical protein